MRHDGFTPISSSHIAGAKYDSYLHQMTVQFKNKSHYVIHGISPEEYQEFLDAPSQGEHMHKFFKSDRFIERVK